MRLYSVYKCDHCGKTEEADGYPKEWYTVEIRRGWYYSDSEEETHVLEKDCCSEKCAIDVLTKYIEEKK